MRLHGECHQGSSPPAARRPPLRSYINVRITFIFGTLRFAVIRLTFDVAISGLTPSGWPQVNGPAPIVAHRAVLRSDRARRPQNRRPRSHGQKTRLVRLGGAMDGGDDDQPDGQMAGAVSTEIERLGDRPWIIAAGFMKPHDPFVAPKKYFDLYPEARCACTVRPPTRHPPRHSPGHSRWSICRGAEGPPQIGQPAFPKPPRQTPVDRSLFASVYWPPVRA